VKALTAFGIIATIGNITGNKIKEVTTGISRTSAKGLYPQAKQGIRYAMMIDSGACIGCRTCLHACKLENNVPDEPSNLHWIDIFEMENTRPVTEVHAIPPAHSDPNYSDSPKEGFWYLSHNCFHCDNPPCTKVCPTGATYQDDDGLVLVNYDFCIGCRYCMAACPYNARQFNWWTPDNPSERASPINGEIVPLNHNVPLRTKGVVEKCTFCVHRIRNGNPIPKCVEVCPVNARHFGDLNDPESEVSRLLETVRTHRIKEELNTHPMLYYFTRGVKWKEDGEKI
jgi:molybdopterin-containing oxidoreductase family iron-sulfur binding subunit